MSNTSRMDERIRELATRMVGDYFAETMSLGQCAERVIRLAVAETAEACAALCDKRARLYRGNARDREAIAADVLAAAIREKARTK